MDDSLSRRILVVDDDPTVAEVVTRYLERDGFEVEHVGDGRTAVERVVADRPALVLLDLKLPKMDGLEVLRSIRKDERIKLLPVVILTSSGEQKDLVESYSLGANAYVRKPVDFSQFSEAVRQLGLFWIVVNEPPLTRGC